MKRIRCLVVVLPVLLVLGLGATPAEEKRPLRVLVACAKDQLRDYQTYLETNYNIQCVWAGDDAKANPGKEKGDKPVQGLEQCAGCDVMLLNLYRVTPSDEQLEHAKKYFAAGKPVVGLRKASHAFQNWLEVDRVVFGMTYKGHFFEDKKNQILEVNKKAGTAHLIADLKPFMPGGGLYTYLNPTDDIEVLLDGGIPGKMFPQVWSRVNKETRGRAFYARYDPDDLKKDEGCRLMIVKALSWAANRELEPKKK